MIRQSILMLLAITGLAGAALADPDMPGKWTLEGADCAAAVLDLPPFDRAGRSYGTLATSAGPLPVVAGESGAALVAHPDTDNEFLILGDRDGAVVRLTGTMGSAPAGLSIGGKAPDKKMPPRLVKCAEAPPPPAPPAPKVASALPDVEPLTLDTLLGDWGYYERGQQRRVFAYRSCVEWDREVIRVEFEGEEVPLYGEVKFVRAKDGTLWYLTEYRQAPVLEIDNPNGDMVVYALAETEVIVMLRSDLHPFRKGLALSTVIANDAEKKSRGGHPIEFFEFRSWNAVDYPSGQMPEGAYRMLKCIPGKYL